MFYVKERINDSMEISIEINYENVFCTCPKCGKEVRVDLVEELEEGDLFSTQVCCNTCSETMRDIYEERIIQQEWVQGPHSLSSN